MARTAAKTRRLACAACCHIGYAPSCFTMVDVYERFVIAELSIPKYTAGAKWPLWHNESPLQTIAVYTRQTSFTDAP